MLTSEVAQLRANIEQELVAMRLGLSGLASGTARHDFIQKRAENKEFFGGYEA